MDFIRVRLAVFFIVVCSLDIYLTNKYLFIDTYGDKSYLREKSDWMINTKL